jgi:uncharacterized ubiquitin-like protein YukD
MKVIVTTLNKETNEFDFDDNTTVMDLKIQISEAKSRSVDTIRLIFNSAVLDNNKKLSECGVKDGQKIIMIGDKPKPQAAQTPAPSVTPAPAPSVPQPTESSEPFNMFAPQPAQPTASSEPKSQQEIMTDALQQNPEMFIQMLMANPQIQTMAQQNPQEFMQMISDPEFMSKVMQAGAEMEDDEEMYNKVFQGGAQLQLSEEDKLVVDEIANMGFGTYEDAVQYYFAYEKNKDAAISALANDALDGNL